PGTARVRLHTPFWEYVNPAIFVILPDDRLRKNSAAGGYYTQAIPNGKLGAIGDKVHIVGYKASSPYTYYLYEAANTSRAMLQWGNEWRWYEPVGGHVETFGTTSGLGIGGVWTGEIAMDSKGSVYANGVLAGTSSYSFLSLPVTVGLHGNCPEDTVVEVPK